MDDHQRTRRPTDWRRYDLSWRSMKIAMEEKKWANKLLRLHEINEIPKYINYAYIYVKINVKCMVVKSTEPSHALFFAQSIILLIGLKEENRWYLLDCILLHSVAEP